MIIMEINRLLGRKCQHGGILVVLLLCIPHYLSAKIIEVPLSYSTIQAAINVATAVDTIKVAAGYYPEHVVMKNGIVLQGTFGGIESPDNPADDAIIDGSASGWCVQFTNITNAMISGFTIQNGFGQAPNAGFGRNIYCIGSKPQICYNLIVDCAPTEGIGPGNGGGICLLNSDAYISGNIIQDNTCWGKGGGIYCDNCSPQIIGNFISGNVADYGAGIYCDHSHPLIKQNVIDNNFADYQDGGGIYCDSAAPTIENNTLIHNRAGQWTNGQGGAIYCYNGSLALIRNNIIAYNSADNSTGGIYCLEGSSPAILNFNDVFGNLKGEYFGCTPQSGSISLAPVFVDSVNKDYHLAYGSPCINAGDPEAIYNDDDGTRNDMGAYGGSLRVLDYTLTATSGGNGTVTLTPSGGTYASGSTVTLTVTPASGYQFSSWSGANSGDVVNTGGVYTIVMNGNKTVQANFTATGVLGDVNESGTITSSDALIILSCAVGLDVSQYCPMYCGDVNASDTVTSSDALIVLSYAVGLSVPYPVGQAGCPTGVTPCPGCE